jgi:Tol biopolymer transport system component
MWARRFVIAFAAASLLTGLPLTASAQYFGRNKVQYKKLDFQILKTEHFDIYYYPEEREGIDVAARMAERWRTRLGRIFGHELRGRQPLVLYASHPDFEQTNAIYGELSEGTGGVTEPLRRRIVLPMGGPLADTDHVIGHELVHAFQFDITTNPNSPPGENGAERLPLWFIEGMAEYLSLGPVDPNTAMWLRDAVREKDEKTGKDTLPSIEELDNPKYFPYRWGQAFWAYVGGKYGDDAVRRMLAFASAAGDTNVAIERVLGIKTKELSAAWQDSIRRTYEPVLAATTPPNEIGRLVIRGTTLGADLNVGPSISPDGKWIAFLSTRSVFSTDLFIADAQSGNVVHRLTSTATDPHFSSIQFIYSAGGWDAASERIAIATVVSGRPALAIFGAKSGDKEREIPLRELDEVFNPTWAPDGHAICFTAMTRGLTDLYVYDLTASKLQRLTNDAYADLMPAWSPDGKRIAFATDRFSSNLETLAIGDYRLALIDPEGGTVQPLRAFTSGKNINPQWTPDGSGLLFISDRDGIPNLYRIAVDSDDVTQVTRIGTGISGITSSSPALSVASRTGEAAFSVYQGGKYDIYALDLGAGPQHTRGANATRGDDDQPPAVETSGALAARAPDAGTLPPLDRRPSEVQALLQNATLGLPPPTEYPTEDYKASLSLEGLAQPTVAVGANRFGAAVGGGIALQFGDMLGDHQLMTAVQLNSGVSSNFSLKNTAAQVMYFNQAHRWNWGVVGGQIPYLSGGFQSGLGTIGNEPAQIEQTVLFRQTEQSVSGIIAYPFSRAQRVEFQGGMTRISFDQIVETTAFSLNSGNLLINDSTTTSIGDALSLANTSAALVYDTSSFGATSPVQGQRYRLEAAPTFGSLNYTTLMADYRRYFMPVSFYTVAARVLHYGRYGSGSDDTRLYPLFIGYPNLVRGYDVGTFNTQDCTPSPVSSCQEFDRLQGSRLLVTNLEFRFPLLRPFGATQRMYGPVPVEVAFFADAGWAWNNLQQAAIATSILGASQVPHPFNWRDGVASAGVAFRVNLFGYAVGQFDFAHPFQRPGSGWLFQFNLSPGF